VIQMNRLRHCWKKSLLPLLAGMVIVLAGCCQLPETPSIAPPLSPVSPIDMPRADISAQVGGQVVFHCEDTSGLLNIYILDLETKALTRLTDGTGNNYDPAFSPDGTRIAFISDRDQYPPYGTPWLMNADGTEPHALLEKGDFFELGPTWSPDGKRIALQSNRLGNPEILILDLESGQLTNLTSNPNVDANPAWSPDGTQVAFASDRSGNPEIWCINVDGSNLRQITFTPMSGEWRPAWSPDGQRLIFESFPSVAPRRLYTQSLNEVTAHEVQNFSIWNTWPTWVTEDVILYAAVEDYDPDSPREDEADLYLQNLQTGELEQLTSGPESDGRPSWRP
jgi:Tol biopolymer transport system component